METQREIRLEVNASLHRLTVHPREPLALVLRNALGLTGTKIGCALEQCGACAVLVDGRATLSCVSPAVDFEGRSIVTVEGLGEGAQLSDVQRAFVAHGAAQCGFCTAGMVIAVTGAIANGAKTQHELADALEPHLCRCGSHSRVIAAACTAAGISR